VGCEGSNERLIYDVLSIPFEVLLAVRQSICAYKIRSQKLVRVEMQISKHPQ
jgi:hypothetical protein